jgi:hypothetical protein
MWNLVGGYPAKLNEKYPPKQYLPPSIRDPESRIGGNSGFKSNRIFSGSSLPLIVFNTCFDISATWATSRTVVKTKIGQYLLINNLLFFTMVQYTPRTL